MNEERFTLRCTVYLFLIKDSKLFLLRRKNTGWMDGKYGIPAGHLEPDETILQAMIRETKEEAGIEIDLQNLKLVHVMHRKSNFDYVDLFFTVETWDGEPKLAEKEKADDAQWFSIENLPQNILTHIKIAFENYQKNIIFSEFGFIA